MTVQPEPTEVQSARANLIKDVHMFIFLICWPRSSQMAVEVRKWYQIQSYCYYYSCHISIIMIVITTTIINMIIAVVVITIQSDCILNECSPHR